MCYIYFRLIIIIEVIEICFYLYLFFSLQDFYEILKIFDKFHK